jgi:hypothetical protein
MVEKSPAGFFCKLLFGVGSGLHQTWKGIGVARQESELSIYIPVHAMTRCLMYTRWSQGQGYTGS